MLTCLIVNEIEGEEIARSFDIFTGDISKMVTDLLLLGDTVFIVTLGKDGAIFACDGNNTHIGAPLIKATDTTGAGDAFVGVFASVIAKDGDLGAAV